MGENDRNANELRQAAWRALLAAHARLVRRIDAELTEAGLLPMDWYDVLLALHEAPRRRIRLSALADRIVFSRSGLTRLVDRLEARGLLRRELCPEDGRGAYAVLTEAGFVELRRTWARYEPLILEHFGRHLSAREAGVVLKVLSRMRSEQQLVQISAGPEEGASAGKVGRAGRARGAGGSGTRGRRRRPVREGGEG
jgi:DNA-binding MarR family transcriptional regulator